MASAAIHGHLKPPLAAPERHAFVHVRPPCPAAPFDVLVLMAVRRRDRQGSPGGVPFACGVCRLKVPMVIEGDTPKGNGTENGVPFACGVRRLKVPMDIEGDTPKGNGTYWTVPCTR